MNSSAFLGTVDLDDEHRGFLLLRKRVLDQHCRSYSVTPALLKIIAVEKYIVYIISSVDHLNYSATTFNLILESYNLPIFRTVGICNKSLSSGYFHRRKRRRRRYRCRVVVIILFGRTFLLVVVRVPGVSLWTADVSLRIPDVSERLEQFPGGFPDDGWPLRWRRRCQQRDGFQRHWSRHRKNPRHRLYDRRRCQPQHRKRAQIPHDWNSFQRAWHFYYKVLLELMTSLQTVRE